MEETTGDKVLVNTIGMFMTRMRIISTLVNIITCGDTIANGARVTPA